MTSKANIREKLLHGSGIFMFMRSVITSQLSSYVDFIVSFLFFALVNLSSALSAALGAFVGGIVNCLVNYKFTFRMKECSYFAIGVKFFMVWLGSLLLNSFGTKWFTDMFLKSRFFDSLDVGTDLRFATARILAAMLVSVFWNFMLQRYFVFRATPFDPFLDRIKKKFSRS